MPDKNDGSGNTPIHVAAETGNMRMLADLVKKGANLDELNANGDTALILAIIGRQLDAVRFLVNKGANVNVVDRNGVSTLVHAAIVDHEGRRKHSDDAPFFDAIIHSKDYKYSEKDMQRIEEFELVKMAPSKSLERVQSNLQKVAAAAEKLINGTKGIYTSLMQHAKGDNNDLKNALKNTNQETVKPVSIVPDATVRVTPLTEPKVDEPPKPRRQ